MRVIDLTTGQAACRPLEFPDRPTALAVTPQKRLAVGFGMMRARQEDLSPVGDVVAVVRVSSLSASIRRAID